MMLLRTPPAEAEIWTAQADLDAEPEQVLRALTDPVMIAGWTPISFHVEGLGGRALRTGSRARVSGTIAGIGAAFDVDVIRADRHALELVARGPVTFEVIYRFLPRDRGLRIDASVAVPRRRGLTAQLLRSATAALLNAGALHSALGRLERCVSSPLEPELAAA